MQLDVERSPPASAIHHKAIPSNIFVSRKVDIMNFCPVTFCLVNFGQVTDRQKAVHMSPPCTGVLNNWKLKKALCRTEFTRAETTGVVQPGPKPQALFFKQTDGHTQMVYYLDC